MKVDVFEIVAAVQLKEAVSGLSVFLDSTYLYSLSCVCHKIKFYRIKWYSLAFIKVLTWATLWRCILYMFSFSVIANIYLSKFAKSRLSYRRSCTVEGSVQSPVIFHPHHILHVNQKCLIYKANAFLPLLKPVLGLAKPILPLRAHLISVQKSSSQILFSGY
jgi:hypothetical protein